jgi:nucleoporin NUP42
VTAEDIKADLTGGKGRPEWIFSAYGPGKNIPRQLFGGPQREQSFEEMRLRHYQAAAAENQNQAIQEAETLYTESLQQIENALKDLDGAVRYIVEGENEHPNRIDITEGRTASNGGQQPPPFGQTTNPFGQPSTTTTQMSSFGQPSLLGSGTPAFGTPAFGQPSGLRSQSAFGQTSSLGQGTSFGQPSTLGGAGQSAFGKPAFGQPSFGQPSSLGQGAFGQQSATSPFAQISNQKQGTSPSGQTPFGQPSLQTSTSPFVQISGQTTLFGQSSQTTSPFAQMQQNAAPFGQPSASFGTAQQKPATTTAALGMTTSPFGQPNPVPTAVVPLPTTQHPQQQTQQQATTNAPANLGPSPIFKVEDKEPLPIPPLNGSTSRDPTSKKLTIWKGRPVKYIDNWPCYLHPSDNTTYVHIFFPDGPPEAVSLRDAQGTPDEYTPEITTSYKFFLQNGYFKDGVLPSIPPKTEWVSFDF